MLRDFSRIDSVTSSSGRGLPCVATPLHVSRRARRSVRARFALLSPPAESSFILQQLKVKEKELLLPLPPLENAADDVALANPLERMKRLSTGWFGVVMEYEGVLVPDTSEQHTQAWLKVADELGYPRPLGHVLKRIKGVRDDVVVMRVFHWTHNPAAARKIAERKGEVFDALDVAPPTAPLASSLNFMEMLCRYSIPIALASALPRERLASSLDAMRLRPYFSGVVSGEDSGAAEVEYYYTYASQLIQRPPARCIVVGESNTTVEAAHELGMKAIIVAGNKPIYNFSHADLVVRSLDQVSFINMKQLFSQEDLVPSRQLPGEGDDVDTSSVDDDDNFTPMGPPSGGAAFGWRSDDFDDGDEEEKPSWAGRW